MIPRSAIALAVATCLLMPIGCGKRTATAPDTTTAAKLNELKAQRRRDRARLRQLEERMAEVARDGHGDSDSLNLPVQRLEPATEEGRATPDDGEVVAVAEDGTEIVYVGEAAQKGSIAANTDLLRERTRPRQPQLNRGATSVASQSRASATRDSLGVTGRRLPKVGEVTKTSAPAPRAREVSATSRRRRPGGASASIVSEYQRQVAALKAGKHAEAVRGLRRFVRRYGRSDYADNAQYWLGEAFYDRKMFTKALREFDKVAMTYPRGNKVPDARLKSAYCKLNLGDTAGARAILSALAKESPGSRIAELAAQKLERLGD